MNFYAINMNEILINTDIIKLDAFLKWSGIASLGSEAKLYIQDGLVKVNGEVCVQRGKKLKRGDVISFNQFSVFRSSMLLNYRNYKNVNIDFSSDVNVFMGDNAQGKTNILESIYYCGLAKSTSNARRFFYYF